MASNKLSQKIKPLCLTNIPPVCITNSQSNIMDVPQNELKCVSISVYGTFEQH